MVLACHNISRSFGEETVLKNVSFHLDDMEKAAIVGINGAGKSTLLKIIMGELSTDTGSVSIAKDKSIGYLAQHQDIPSGHSIYDTVLDGRRGTIELEEKIRLMEEQMDAVPPEDMDEFLSRYHRLLDEFNADGGYSYKSEVSGVLRGLGFSGEDFAKECGKLSGGQKTRVALAKLLVSRPDIMLLDEPTNHLDIESIAWLENFIINYKGTVLIVSHDRYFIDRAASKIIEISLHVSSVYGGSYAEYAEAAAKARQDKIRAYLNQQREIKHQEAVIEKLKSFNREKSIKRAESRQKALDKVEVLEKPSEENSRMRLILTPDAESGKDVLSVCGLSKAYGENTLFRDISFDIKRGERVAVIGANGTGKTTILKIINGIEEADKGRARIGTNVHIGYYDQEIQNLDPEKTLFEEVSDRYPQLDITRIRNVLAAFLFTGDDAEKKISSLSGGERGRLSLAMLMLSGANFLILDEPTNHLDIPSKEILEEALLLFEGTVLFVSHDRYFINRIATRIMDLKEGQIVEYIGNYDYYIEKKADNEKAYLKAADTSALSAAKTPSEGRAGWEAKKEENARARKLENRIKKLEDEIECLEGELSEIEEEYLKSEVASNSAKLNELMKIQKEVAKKLEELYAEWERLVI